MSIPTPIQRVDCRLGAPMGRGGYTRAAQPLPVGARFNLRRVYLNSGGYDTGGAYWGCGVPLYWAGAENPADPEGDVSMFFRAGTRAAAKAYVREAHPDARFA
jgi:hypothetical protein